MWAVAISSSPCQKTKSTESIVDWFVFNGEVFPGFGTKILEL